PSYAYMVFVLGALACLGPFTIDAYLPAFGAIGREFDQSRQAVQSTLGYYMLAYAVTTLFHGTLSDSFGRRRVLIVALSLYSVGALTAALAPSFEWLVIGRILQGLSAGAGMIVGQAIVNDCYKGAVAQRTMSYIIMVFSVSPALAPIIGGYLAAGIGWRSIFFAMLGLALATIVLCVRGLPETLLLESRHRFSFVTLIRNMKLVLRDRFFLGYSLAAATLFAGFGFMIGATHDFVTEVLALPDTAFGYLFIPLVVGMVSGSFTAARLAQRVSGPHLIALGYGVAGSAALFSLIYNGLASQTSIPGGVLPLGVYALGLTLAFPSITLTVLRRAPAFAGTAASLLNFVEMTIFSIASGWGVVLVYGSAWKLALALTTATALSALFWWCVHRAEHRPANA
ncbi:MAG: multidrug effflux MFS transporter, partial [Burkholderiaceae bacterium]|nr:multidrug effflux MFS transporter [Burkholderiaceae bacterium]